MLIDQITNAGALPTLEAVMRFAGQRQRLLAHNVANLSTPGFQGMDVSVRAFQDTLRQAIEERRKKSGGMHGTLEWEDTREVHVAPDGAVALSPRTPGGGILAQDRNSRDLERLMQDVAENTAAFRVASDLFRQQAMMMRGAMAERVG